ncbi:MAG TPA: phosphopantetheine-binding protein [Streptosporangiaceae bacterium]|jgi:acyl carrier protein|nr:phosphopantetheine-binding protein [Streptosporangiaceae bacterium]
MNDLLGVTLAAYAEVLGQPQVQPDDDFFAIGGDSMLAMDVVSIIETATGTEISPALFFTYPTAAEFASVLAEVGLSE